MNRELVVHSDPKSPISEVYRALRTNLQFKNASNKLKSLLVTSTVQSEGKSITAANLAIAFAQAGKATVIIDADMRKARQHEIFGIKPTPGLSNYLSGVDENGYDGSDNVTDYIVKTEVDNLSILPAGNIPPNPSELLVSSMMGKMMDKLNKTFDVIIFDGTPSLVVTDSIALSRIVDSSIIVVAHKFTKTADLQKVKRDIENVGGNIAGIVLNKMQMSINKYKEKYYYYGAAEDSGIEGIPTKRRGKKERHHGKEIEGQQLIDEKPVEKPKTHRKKMAKKEETVEPNNNCLDIAVYKEKSKVKTATEGKQKGRKSKIVEETVVNEDKKPVRRTTKQVEGFIEAKIVKAEPIIAEVENTKVKVAVKNQSKRNVSTVKEKASKGA